MGIPTTLDQDLQHVAVRVDRPPKPVLLASDCDHDLVEVAFVGRARTVAKDTRGDLRSEPLATNADAFVGDDHISLGQQILDIAQAQRKAVIRPDGVRDDGTGEAKALQARLCETLLIMTEGYARSRGALIT